MQGTRYLIATVKSDAHLCIQTSLPEFPRENKLPALRLLLASIFVFWRRFVGPGHVYLTCLLTCLLLVEAQAATLRTLRFEGLNTDAALTSETAQAIVQDKHGFIWFGSDGGLRRFDGYQIIHYKHQANLADGLQNPWVQSLFVDPNGILWVGTRGGLHRYNPSQDNFTLFVPEDNRARGKEHLHIMAIISDGQQGLWLATQDGLQHFDPASGKFQIFRNDPSNLNSLVNNQTNALAHDQKGNLWIGTAAGLDRFHIASRRFEHFLLTQDKSDDPKRNAVQTLWIDKTNSLWIGSIGGLEVWRLGRGEPQRRRFSQADGLSRGWVTTLFQDADANLWVGTFEGLHLWDASSNRFLQFRHSSDDPLSLGDNRISAQFQDRSGTLWVGTWFSGIARVDLASGGFASYSHRPQDPLSISNNSVNAISADKRGMLWLATNDGLNRLDPNSGEFRVFKPPALKIGLEGSQQINNLAIDAQNRAWIGTPHGLYLFDTEKLEFGPLITPAKSAEGNFIRQIYPDRGGNLWLATRGGLYRYDPQTQRQHVFAHNTTNPNSLSDNFVRAVLEDRQGNIWIGTFNGLDKLDPETGLFTHFRHDPNNPSSLSSDRITFLFQDRRGLIWVGTGAGLNRMDNSLQGKSSFVRYNPRGVKDSPVYAMEEAKDGQLWISTDVGITRFDPGSGRNSHYFARDGMAEGAYVIGASFAANSGVFYFGSESGGLTAFRPESIRNNPHPPQVVITSVRLNDQVMRPRKEVEGFTLVQPIYQTRQIDLSYRHTTFAFEFAALHYADPNKNRYAYQLQGVDRDWIAADAKTRRASYSNLEPGKYVFRVRAANKDGLWNEAGTTLTITIGQVFWKTWWFLAISSSLLLISAWSAYRSRIRGFTRQKRLLEEQVAIRTAEVIQQKQIVEQKNALVERQKLETELKNELLEQQKYEVERQKENVELAHHNISVLSEIGREITATLDRDAIMCNVYRHIQGLLDATSFAIYLMDDDRLSLSMAFRVESGGLKLPQTVQLNDFSENAARCVREQREIAIDLNRADFARETEADKLPLLSQLYAPLATGNRVLGAMTILSRLEHAYGAREQLIFRTLCAYVAIALDNAAAYRQLGATLKTLRETQAQMVQQEKMASLGTLTAGVAHEINNPANFAHVGAQALAADLERFRHFLIDLAGEDAESEVIQSLNSRLDQLSSQIGTIIEGTTRIKNLVLDLRTFSRLDQATKKTVAIGDSLMSTINLVRTQYAQTAEIQCTLNANPVLECFPAELNQVFMNLIVNACQAMQSRARKINSKEKGCLQIRSKIDGEWLLIEFEDNGDGIPQAIIDHIFEPFFTTKTVGEGTGLGLSISFGIIEKHHGSISVTSQEGVGTCFSVRLPLAEQLNS